MKSDLFPVIILAGGLATRLRPMITGIPKSLISINGEPFIDHQLRLLVKQGIHHVILCVGYLGEMIEAHVGDGKRFNIHIEYSYDGSMLLGTGGAIKQAFPSQANTCFILYGDSYLPCDYAAIQAFFLENQKISLMTVFHNQGKLDASNVEYTNQKIITYDKKKRTQAMQYIDYGLGILTKEAINLIPKEGVFDLVSLYQTLIRSNQLCAYEVTQRFYEIGSLMGINELSYYLLHKDSIAS